MDFARQTCSPEPIAVGLCRLSRGLGRAASDRHCGHVFGPLAARLNGGRYFDPKELTVYLIAAATGPAAFGTAICYFLRVPKVDFAMIVMALWLVTSMADRIGFAIAIARLHDPWRINPTDDRRRSVAVASLPPASPNAGTETASGGSQEKPLTAQWCTLADLFILMATAGITGLRIRRSISSTFSQIRATSPGRPSNRKSHNCLTIRGFWSRKPHI